MAILYPLRVSFIFFAVYVACLYGSCNAAAEERKIHIVYMGALREGETLTSTDHASMLKDVVNTNALDQALVRSYTRSFNGFAAYLTEDERLKLASLDEVVSVFPSRILQPQTTASWDFMGFPETVKRSPSIESDVIIGVIDTGIWPESKSFSDDGFGIAPKKWKGVCRGGKNFTCNKKLIGARFYGSPTFGADSARDTAGHGSHTASTAAGNSVKNTSFFGIASGTARGGVPSARIAAYKVCFQEGCTEADILAAFDDAIADGVDIITISIGSSTAAPLPTDTIAIGSFHAIAKGILTVNSAGNNGLEQAATSSVAPWLISVAASTTNRGIINKVVLGNGKTLIGKATNSFQLKGTRFPLVNGGDAGSEICTKSMAQLCSPGCLNSSLVKGKIVVCQEKGGVQEAHLEGAVGAIVLRGKTFDVSPIVPLPASILSPQDIKLVEDYIKSTRAPKANILKSEPIQNPDAPVVASFSSRGPNTIVPEILKPDVTAPGVEILAAFSPLGSVSDDFLDKRSVQFSFLSGTSMSCPHTAGAAAYVKTFHPDWSPSAIKSSLMTTAWRLNATNNPEAEFAYGAGHIDPVKAVNPGLVYETSREDYITLLCSLHYDLAALRKIIGDKVNCPAGQRAYSPKDMNYPSMTFQLEAKQTNFSVKFPRTVTNVGSANSTYKAKVSSPPHVDIKVEPDTLSFRALNEKKSFVVTATGDIESFEVGKKIVSASLEWSDDAHVVRSPIVVYRLPTS